MVSRRKRRRPVRPRAAHARAHGHVEQLFGELHPPSILALPPVSDAGRTSSSSPVPASSPEHLEQFLVAGLHRLGEVLVCASRWAGGHRRWAPRWSPSGGGKVASAVGVPDFLLRHWPLACASDGRCGWTGRRPRAARRGGGWRPGVIARSVVPAPMSTSRSPSLRSSPGQGWRAEATADGTSSSTARPQRWMHLSMFCERWRRR